MAQTPSQLPLLAELLRLVLTFPPLELGDRHSAAREQMGHPPSVVGQELATFPTPMAALREIPGFLRLVLLPVVAQAEAQGILGVGEAVVVLTNLAEPGEKREGQEIPVLMVQIPLAVVVVEQEVQADHREGLEVQLLVVLAAAVVVVAVALWCTGKGVKNEKSTYFP
jgi:hypothetical protein